MQSINEVFKRIQEHKREQKQIRDTYNESLQTHDQYQNILKEIKGLQLKKKVIEAEIRSYFKKETERLDTIKLNIVGENQLLSDLSLATLVSGQTVKVIDNNKIEYEPQFSVKFKKR